MHCQQIKTYATSNVGCDASHPEDNISRYNVKLPPPPGPKANYSLAIQSGDLLFLSGHLPMTETADNGQFITGSVGSMLTTEEGYRAARHCGKNLIATIKDYCDGDLSRVDQIVKVFGLVQCETGYDEQPTVVNGVSDLFIEVFGASRGRGARSAVGVNALPFGVSVEVEAIVRLKK